MKSEYRPSDIALALAKLSGETSLAAIERATYALCDLKSICENRKNTDYFRDLYALLERVTSETIYK